MHGVEETVEDQNISTEDQHVVEDQRKLEKRRLRTRPSQS